MLRLYTSGCVNFFPFSFVPVFCQCITSWFLKAFFHPYLSIAQGVSWMKRINIALSFSICSNLKLQDSGQGGAGGQSAGPTPSTSAAAASVGAEEPTGLFQDMMDNFRWAPNHVCVLNYIVSAKTHPNVCEFFSCACLPCCHMFSGSCPGNFSNFYVSKTGNLDKAIVHCVLWTHFRGGWVVDFIVVFLLFVRELAETQLQCAVCSELFVEAVSVNCGHTFCEHCIGEWRKKKNNCPVCRTDIRVAAPCKVSVRHLVITTRGAKHCSFP